MQPFVSFLPQQPFELGTSQQDQYKTYAEHLYAYVNAEDNQDYLNKSKSFFGELPKLSEQEDVYATFMGQQLVNMAGFGDTPELYMQAFNIEKPKNAFYRQELYQAIGKQFITKSKDDYKERKRKADEWQKKQTEAIKNARATIPAILASGRPLTAKDMQELTEAGLSDRFSTVAGDVQEAMDYLRTIVSPDPKALQDEAERVKKEWYNSVHLAWTKDRTDDEHMQQAAANLAKGYNLSREQLAHVLALLKDSKGNLDPETIGLFIATLNEKVNKEKTIDSAFWRNVAFGISDFAAASIDAQKRASTKRTSHGLNFVTGAGASLVGGNVGGYVTPTIEQQQAATSQFEKYYSSEMEQLRAGMLAVHDNALSPSDQSGWLAGALTMGGSIVGSEVIPFAVSTLATRGMGTIPSLIVGGAANAASRYPSAVSRNISTAYAQGKKNPEAYAAIYSIPQVGLESAFSAVGGTGVGKLGSELLWKAGKSIPGFARAAGAVQSSALLRWATGGAAEAFGELFIEDPAAELTSKAVFESINAIAGRKVFDAPEWKDVKKALLSNVEDSRQAIAITAYAFALGALGIGGNITKSRQFALSLENLKAAGHSIEAATEISHKAAQTEDKIQEIRANANISEIEKKKQIDELALSFAKWQQGKLRSDILDADYDTLAKRFAANSKEYLAQAEAKLYIETGATKAIHKQLGIRDEQPLPNGNHLISSMVEDRKADGSTELKEERYELSESQYLNLIAFQNGKNLRRHYANYASALLGNAAVRKARSAENITHDLINIKDLANVSEAYTHIARKGAIDFQGAQLIAKAVAAKRNELINSGMTLQQANATADAATGATLGSLANIAAAFQNRVETAVQTSEGQAKGITAAENAESIAMRLPSAKSIGDSVVLYSSGEITLSELAEELVESDLEKAVAAGTSLDSIRDNLIHVQQELQAISPDIRILPKKKPQDMTRQDIIEAYSTLQAVDIIHRADRLPVSESARAIIKYALGQSQLAQTTRVLGDAWASYANSEAGQQYLATSGKTISDLLDAAGISQSSLYSDLRVAEEDRIAVEAAQDFNPISATEQEQKDLDTAAEKADQAARTNTEAGLPRTEIPAEESATGEPLPVDPLETADNDPSTGEYSPSPLDETATDPAFNGITSKSPFGITTGMMPPANLKPHPALANTPQVAAADFSPQYNPNAKPILALRMPDGGNLIVAGRTRQQIALADPNCKAVKVTLIDYDPAIHTDAWVQMTNAGEHIINRTATTEHFRTYFTHNPITHAQAIEQGLVPIDPTTGQPTAAYTKGRQLAIFKDGKYSHASQQDADVLTGEVPIDLITHSDEVPQFKTNKAGNRPGKDGVVYALPGEYRTHDPIHIWQRTDGTLVIISGRHRLAKAKEAGATHIPATVYPETDIRNAAWARTHDAEQNVLDNQASVADTAKYVRGENPKARKLTEEETKQFTRKGSNSEKGSFIGLHGSDHLMHFLSAGVISDEYAFKIAKAYPDDHDAQNLAVDEIVLADKGIREAMTAADIYRDNKANKDDAFSALFKSSQQEEDFNRFLGSYAAQKIRELGTKRSKRKAAATDRSVREHKEAGISFDDLDRTRKEYANYTIEQHKWRNASQYPELRQEAYEAFLKTAEGAQDYFDFGSLSIRAKQDTPAGSFSPSQQETSVSPTATLSLRRRVDRNINSLLNEKETTLARVSNFIRKEAARTEKIMGNDTEMQRAGVHFAQANAILNALDVNIFSKELIRKNTEEYRKLRDLRSFISEYITVARKGKLPVKRNTKYGTPKQAIRKQLEEALDAELSSITESIAASGAGITAEQKKNLRELLISKFANENATLVLSAMMETAGNIIDTHLRNSIIDRMETSLRKMQPQLTPSRKFKRNTVDAETQHRLNLALRYLTINKDDRSTLELAFEPALISAELQKLEAALATPNITREDILKNMPHGIVRQAYEHVISQGGEPTIEHVEDEVASMENAFNTYAYLRESTLNDTMRAFITLNNAVYNARFDWELKTEQRRAQDRAYIADAILNIPTEKATQNYQANNKTKLTRQLGEVLQDNLMSASQVFEALRGVAGYRQLATETVNRIANSSIAISLREREIDLSLVESWLRIFKPDAYAALPTDTNKRNRELRKWENTDYTYFQSDCNQIVETDITLTPELTKAAKAIMEERGISAAEGGKLVLTKGEMLDILLTAEQPHYESNLRAAGYTEEVLNKMRSIVGEELMNYGYAMRDLLLNSGVAEVYQERTGHALPDNPYYWPGSVAYTSAKQEAQPDQSTFAAAPQSSFLKKRVKSMHELRPQNAFAKFRSNMAARNNYIYAQPIVDQWNRLLRNPDFANRLKGVVGDSLVSTVKKALDVLSNAAWGDTIMTDTHTRFFAAIQSGHAISVLAGNISTLLKQLSALNHVGIFAKSGSGLLEWTKTIMRTLHAAPGHNVIGVGEMLESDAFRARWQNNAEYNHFLRMGRGASWGKIRQACKGLANLGMSAIAGMDIAANALSACVLYNSNYNYYTKQNNTLPEPARKTDAEIRNQCMQDVNNMLELAAQPLRQSQKALLLATSNSLIVKGTFYMATEVVNKLGMAQARSLQTYHKTGSSFKAALSRFGVLSSVGLPAAIIGMAIYAANNGIPDDDDELLAWLLSGAAQGVTGASLLGGMPVVGPAITSMFNAHAYKNQQWSQLVPDAVKVTDHFSDLYSMLKTSNSWTNAELAKTSNACLRDLAFIANGAATCTRGIPYLGTTLSATANALMSLAAASNATLIPTATADTLSGNKNIPNSKNSTRKKAHKQSIAEALITKAIADDDYEKRKKKRTSERSRHTRKENSKKKAAERKAKNNS